MKIDNINTYNVNHKSIFIPRKSPKNTDYQFLYNNILNVVNKQKVGADFTNEGVKIGSSHKENILMTELKKLGIDFIHK